MNAKHLPLLLALAAALLVAGCGGASEPDDAGGSGGPTTTPHEVFRIGTDLEAGVYTAEGVGCAAVAASSAEYDLMTDAREDDWLRASMLVGDVRRIEVHRGEFLHTYGCTWIREDGTSPRTPDPATLAGRCAILTGPDRLAETALSYAGRPIPEGESLRVGLMQERLTTVGFQVGRRMSHPAGVLIDVLDDPKYYTPGTRIRAEAEQAVKRIQQLCRGIDPP